MQARTFGKDLRIVLGNSNQMPMQPDQIRTLKLTSKTFLSNTYPRIKALLPKAKGGSWQPGEMRKAGILTTQSHIILPLIWPTSKEQT